MNNFPYQTREYDILPYDNNWAVRFDTLAQKLKGIFGDDALDIQHIGSTSIPGMEAKPIIDVVVIIQNGTDPEMHRQEMEKHFVYEGQKLGEHSLLYRESKSEEILANIHIFPEKHPHVSEMLQLRDYLRSHPDDVQEYSEIKKKLHQNYPSDYAEYRKQKDAYLDEVLKKRAGI